MKLWELESYLGDVTVFKAPKVKLEQYPTTPHLAARMLFTISDSYDDIDEKVIADFGVGCGVLSIGAAILGANQVIGIDVDKDAIDIAEENIGLFDLDGERLDITLVNTDISQMTIDEDSYQVLDHDGNILFEKDIDVVIMNPPFGTKNKGIDMVFVEQAIMIADTVYSLHKTSTRAHILRKAVQWGVNAEVLAELRFDLPNTYRFHKKNNVDIEVDLIRFSR
eukprot:TRINITY_DN9731_c0_g1_i1.p1 TRINITY_DN9731_c0_g1~~TRINITY_DN9731_c0_g1_i1.p1  ORF type:complete len:223 (-),score=56.10 TRINITY_DN9731_c0_g1_i1:51-719(-)